MSPDKDFGNEDAEHYFFFCNGFTQQRTSLFQAIRLVLHGSPDLSNDENVEYFSQVPHFI